MIASQKDIAKSLTDLKGEFQGMFARIEDKHKQSLSKKADASEVAILYREKLGIE
jgi:hypothetical protein